MNITFSKNLILLILVLILGSVSPIAGQIEGVSPKDIEIQRIFIEANKEKILKRYPNAIKQYELVLKRDPNNHTATYEIARIYEAMDENAKAKKYIEEAIRKDGSNKWYRIFLADLHDKMKEPLNAASIYGALANQEPGNSYYLKKQGYYLVLAKEPEKAIKVYNELEELIGVSEEITRKKHTLYYGMGKNKKAAAELRKLMDFYPNNIDYYHLLATFFEQTGGNDEAKKVYKEILAVDPDDAEAKLALEANVKSVNNGAIPESLKNLFRDESIEIDLKVQKILPTLERISANADEKMAVSMLELAEILEKVHPNEAKSYSLHGDLLYFAGQRDEAAAKYEHALDFDKSVFSVWRQLMFICAEKKNYEKLADISDGALEYFPNQPLAYYLNGVALSALQNYRTALPSLNQALLMSSRNKTMKTDILNRLGEVHFQLNDHEKAFGYFEKAVAENPQAVPVIANYAYHLALEGNQLEKSLSLANQALQLDPKHPGALTAQGLILYHNNDFETARAQLLLATENDPTGNPRTLELLGDVFFRLGNAEQAQAYWQKALDNGGNSEWLEKKISDKKLYE